jgi:hypothetical protein
MSYRARILVVALLALRCAHSKATPDKPSVDSAAIARSIVLCKTTEADLRSHLGEPSRNGILHEQRIVSWIMNNDGPIHYLAVLVDARGVVVDLYWDIPTEVPWTPTDQCRATNNLR